MPIYCLQHEKKDLGKMLKWLVKNSKPKVEVDFVFYDLGSFTNYTCQFLNFDTLLTK